MGEEEGRTNEMRDWSCCLGYHSVQNLFNDLATNHFMQLQAKLKQITMSNRTLEHGNVV